MLLKVSFLKETVFSELSTMKTHNQNTFKKSFIVGTSNGVKKITTEEIVAIMSADNATFLLANNKINYVLSSSLEKLEEELDSTQFFRINRKFIINKRFVKEIQNTTHVIITVTSNQNLKISRSKRKTFLKWFGD